MNENQLVNINTTEVREYLGVSNFVVNNLIKQGQLTPINKDTWRLDGSFLFKREDVEAIKKERETEGLTLYQASKRYDVSTYQLEKWLEDGELTATIQEHRNRETKFIKEEDLCKLVQKFDQANSLYTYSQKHNTALFQRYIQGNTIARIISIPKRGDIMLVDEFGSEFTLKEAKKLGYVPAYELSDKPRSQHQRFVKFRIPKSEQLRSSSFQLIDLILQYVSPRNLKISEEEGFWYFNVRQSLIELPMGMQLEWIESLTPYLIEGKLVKRVNNSVYLDSSSVTKPVTMSSKEYQAINKIVEETNSTIEEFITTAIREKISQYKNSQN
ncbi:helix-turn-helix domain-containing protein [Bacillus pseudomycoides]|uniref:helix-turn-helix domain-containing protein n=1 Tax=Bacillus pseudomycoides TaxID=64104 RepID=UPI000BF83EF1|nr:helix-turn-helix domain-containing protein [Bacillus pseudomycoides]PGD70611.1 DNA-binding protein [Bacillus pseudomycoides]